MRTSRTLGFSLLELLIVIAIIVILMTLLLSGILGTKDTAKKVETQTLLGNITAAAFHYSEFFGQYPPDTGKFLTGNNPDFSVDPDSIYKYLGRKVTDASGKSLGPLLTIKPEFLKGLNGQTLVDHWGSPIQLDCTHTKMDTASGDVTRYGEPYPSGTPSEQITAHMRAWSYGPDKKDATGSNVMVGKGGAPADADNICSWAP